MKKSENKPVNRQSITCQDVLDILESTKEKLMTVDQLASELNVSDVTIKNRIRKLRLDGVKLIPTKNGIQLMDIIKNMNDAEIMRDFLKWTVMTTHALLSTGNLAKPLLPSVRKLLKESLTKEQLSELVSNTNKLAVLLTVAQAERENE